MDKLKIDNAHLIADFNALKAIDSSTIDDLTIKFVDTDFYIYYIDAIIGDHKPDDLGQGYWIKNITREASQLISVVADTYNFVSNNATDISSIESWDKFGYALIGYSFGFKDIMSLRGIIKTLIESKCGSDYSTFETSLNDNEKEIAHKFLTTKIIKHRGYVFFSAQCGGDESASKHVDNYVNMAESGRDKRYRKFVLYAYSKLENTNGLKAEKRVRENQLKAQFIERGVTKKSDDDLDGLSDWLNGTVGTSFENDSMINSLNVGTYTLNDVGLTKQQFVDNCIGILESGLY